MLGSNAHRVAAPTPTASAVRSPANAAVASGDVGQRTPTDLSTLALISFRRGGCSGPSVIRRVSTYDSPAAMCAGSSKVALLARLALKLATKNAPASVATRT